MCIVTSYVLLLVDAMKKTTDLLIVWTFLVSVASAKNDLPYLSNKAIQSNTRCKTIPFKMTINKPDCFKRKIDNNLCVGSCLSAFIPQHGNAPLEACNICQPVVEVNMTIGLTCRDGDRYFPVEEQVTVFKHCGCTLKNGPCKPLS